MLKPTPPRGNSIIVLMGTCPYHKWAANIERRVRREVRAAVGNNLILRGAYPSAGGL
jgi:hypothetical protein